MPDQTEHCPICAFSSESEMDLYTHLLTSHRKRAITDVLLDSRSAHPRQ